jgi:hypothetical protein
LKKQKAKKGGATKKKDDAESSAPSSVLAEQAKDEPEVADDDEAEEAIDTIESPKKSHGRTPSVSIQSKLRSESFRKESPLSPGAGDSDPAFKIEALEKENRRLQDEKDEAEKRWKKLEEELQELKEEQSGGGDWLKQADDQANEVEKLVYYTSAMIYSNAKLILGSESRNRVVTAPEYTALSRQTQIIILRVLAAIVKQCRYSRTAQFKNGHHFITGARDILFTIETLFHTIKD